MDSFFPKKVIHKECILSYEELNRNAHSEPSELCGHGDLKREVHSDPSELYSHEDFHCDFFEQICHIDILEEIFQYLSFLELVSLQGLKPTWDDAVKFLLRRSTAEYRGHFDSLFDNWTGSGEVRVNLNCPGDHNLLVKLLHLKGDEVTFIKLECQPPWGLEPLVLDLYNRGCLQFPSLKEVDFEQWLPDGPCGFFTRRFYQFLPYHRNSSSFDFGPREEGQIFEPHLYSYLKINEILVGMMFDPIEFVESFVNLTVLKLSLRHFPHKEKMLNCLGSISHLSSLSIKHYGNLNCYKVFPAVVILSLKHFSVKDWELDFSSFDDFFLVNPSIRSLSFSQVSSHETNFSLAMFGSLPHLEELSFKTRFVSEIHGQFYHDWLTKLREDVKDVSCNHPKSVTIVLRYVQKENPFTFSSFHYHFIR